MDRPLRVEPHPPPGRGAGLVPSRARNNRNSDAWRRHILALCESWPGVSAPNGNRFVSTLLISRAMT